MRATGIVRRIDDLGRVAIPKEIRRAFDIAENDSIVIFTEILDGKQTICLRKYETSLKETT